MTSPSQKASAAAKGGAAAAAIAAACALVLPFTQVKEGTKLVPYRDMGGVWTVCTGETRVAMRRYTPAECRALLDRALASDYAPPVLRCAPQLADNRFAYAASIDAAYNAGAGAFCRSPMAASFRVRDWRRGCAAFIGWRATVKGRPVRGLQIRRREEAELCARGHGA